MPSPVHKNFIAFVVTGMKISKIVRYAMMNEIFEDECNDPCEDFMRDFYSETVLTMEWCKKIEEDRKKR